MRVKDRVMAYQGETTLQALWVMRSFCKPLGLQKMYHKTLIRLLRKTGLFDRSWYLDINSDVADAGTPPLRHYVAYGDREGRPPMPFFDPAYYRAHAQGQTKHVNALLHYALVGRYRRISPSPWFDVEYYLRHNKDVARSGIDPLLHYLKFGGLEGRSPCPQFDGSYYLRSNPDVVESRMNPLLHYLLSGRLEDRRTLPEQVDAEAPEPEAGEVPQAALPSSDAWSGLKPRAGGEDIGIDVVVPVYKGRVETLRCLYSVLSAAGTAQFELVVINDASPDSELTEDLRRLAASGLCTLIENQANRGFVYSVNAGMELHKNRDVVLLNADAEVYDGWLDRLNRAAMRNERTGTVTPLSNNALICSYPRFLHDNPFPLEIDYPELDALTARLNCGEEVEAPTGVGFCMYVKRVCLDDVGLFDMKAFGKGYGEENDFCQRAIRKGWRNVIAADVFVRHWGSASFQGEKAKRVRDALKVLGRRYPQYQRDVEEFIKRDPLGPARRRLDWDRLKRMVREKNVLIVSHRRGGGTERHIQEDIQSLTLQGYGVFCLRPAPRLATHAVLNHPSIKILPNMPHFALGDSTPLKQALTELGISEVHVHSLVDFVPSAAGRIADIIRDLNLRCEKNVHDYTVVCPRVNLADENGRYCGEPEEEECNTCLRERGSDFGVQDIRAWREVQRRILQVAEKVLVPDQDVADRLKRYYPEVRFEVSPHEEIDRKVIETRRPELSAGEKLRVVTIGAIGKLKGFDVLLACAAHAREKNLPLEFILLGYSMNDRLLEEAGVRVTGKYQEQGAPAALKKLKPQIILLPSLWPETYSYTLSLALRTNVPVMAFDLGAIAARLRRLERTELLVPLHFADRPAKLNSLLLKGRVRTGKKKDAVRVSIPDAVHVPLTGRGNHSNRAAANNPDPLTDFPPEIASPRTQIPWNSDLNA